MLKTVFDVEADGLLTEATVIYCLCYEQYEDSTLIGQGSFTSYQDMREFIIQQEVLIGHNIIRFDIPILEKFLGIKINATLVDTLGISWYLYPDRLKHGLESWGETLGIEKVKIDDWHNLSIDDYVRRCVVDVKINSKLYFQQESYLSLMYNNIFRVIRYIGFKMDCLKDQEEEGIKIDVELCLATKQKLEGIIQEKITRLSQAMPKSLGKIIRTKPKIRQEAWKAFLLEKNLPEDTLIVREDPNPTSIMQLKEWLYSLGWKPVTFKFSKSTGKNVPQISLPFGQGLCNSVKELYEVEPVLEELDGLFIAQHRLGIMDAFLEERDKDDRIYSTAHGFTNTMRLQHSKPVVNLPSINKPYGNEIRGCLIIPDQSYVMCGADVSGLEDNTKQHYIYFYDPVYVTQMRVPGFDPHIDIALVGKMITEEDAEFYKTYEAIENPTQEEKDRYKKIKKIRQDAKVVNFSATYGAGPPKIAETLRKSLQEATLLHSTYWKRNKAVKQTANAAKVRVINGQKWLYNPISGFWMFLKAEKDRFSTLNQSSGVYVFDTWLSIVREKIKPIKVIMQYHDELLLVCKKEERDFVDKSLTQAMKEANERLKLNVTISISTSWGDNYADCH